MSPLANIYKVSRITLAIIWLYHGLVPKLLFGNHQEVMMNDAFMPFVDRQFALMSSGVLEVIFAACVLIFYRSKVINYISIAFATLVLFPIIIVLPELYQNAFNPFSTNLGVISLAIINLMSYEGSK